MTGESTSQMSCQSHASTDMIEEHRVSTVILAVALRRTENPPNVRTPPLLEDLQDSSGGLTFSCAGSIVFGGTGHKSALVPWVALNKCSRYALPVRCQSDCLFCSLG